MIANTAQFVDNLHLSKSIAAPKPEQVYKHDRSDRSGVSGICSYIYIYIHALCISIYYVQTYVGVCVCLYTHENYIDIYICKHEDVCYVYVYRVYMYVRTQYTHTCQSVNL